MVLKTYEDIVHEALADCAEAGYPQHSISESIYGLAKERDEAVKELEAIKNQGPVCQHSFTVDGHTFYADSEVDILHLERKFGVGGKAKLNLVEDK